MTVTEDHLLAVMHPTRARILGQFNGTKLSPRELTEQLGDVSLGSVSYHVRVLRDARLLKPAGTKQVRGAIAHYYTVARPATIPKLAAQVDAIAAALRGQQRGKQ